MRKWTYLQRNGREKYKLIGKVIFNKFIIIFNFLFAPMTLTSQLMYENIGTYMNSGLELSRKPEGFN